VRFRRLHRDSNGEPNSARARVQFTASVASELLQWEHRKDDASKLEGGEIVAVHNLWPAETTVKVTKRREVVSAKRDEIGKRRTIGHVSQYPRRLCSSTSRGQTSLVRANAPHIKQVPGRKTDVKDCEWIAELRRHGLLPPSYVPDRPQRELRQLTRFRTTLVRERAREVNRIQKTLEGANVKLGDVCK
jgi:Transposase